MSKSNISVKLFEIILKYIYGEVVNIENINSNEFVNIENIDKWSKENFKTLKITLQQCLSLIRYFHIIEKDIWEKLKPYLNPSFYPARIISTSELPPRMVFIPKHFEIFAMVMHAGTKVIAKVAGTDELLGGYNPLAWDNLKTKFTYMETIYFH
ncbi:hypothetical protein Glove_18g37 [Diversispora epigaea]|uniref:BTB domain-containing protein n=1 Tax=Diversispora epigaea TaxID=1348612 RepID=A0A397JNI7_9GLOM|nr:hypothetical protein Glove_18g37 [Diversispora epigaea]